MCGIIAVLRRRSDRVAPSLQAGLALLARARASFSSRQGAPAIHAAADALSELDRLLRGVPGLCALLDQPSQRQELGDECEQLQRQIAMFEASLDSFGTGSLVDAAIEAQNAALLRLKDHLWAIQRDRLPHAEAVAWLAKSTSLTRAAATSWSSVAAALTALDRLEVRGRDSAGITLLVSGLGEPILARATSAGRDDPLGRNRALRTSPGCIAFSYKRAAEIGELGDNVAALRESLRTDELLRDALNQPEAAVLVLGHTRWASVGIISEPNTHPLDERELAPAGGPLVISALNGDVDNHHDLILQHGLQIAEPITTDAKVIPTLLSRALLDQRDLGTAFQRTVATFEGSVAIGAACAAMPNLLAISLRGSGQALYVGCAEDTYIVASEPYGVVEECAQYLRLDGETPGNPENPTASRGQVVVLDRNAAGELAGVQRLAFDGTPLPIRATELATAKVTTRDIDRGEFRHYLLKELTQAPDSFRKTLRGRIVAHGDSLRVALPSDSLPIHVSEGLRANRFRIAAVIGQGTAAVAGQAVAASMREALHKAAITVVAMPATELSGFELRDDMRDTLVVAISQSGTTTDTNRTVDLVRARGAAVIAIVNRRGSDLCDKAEGVLFTSDGRDVEMSVASTKAFYAQCAAGQLLALALARAAGCANDQTEHTLLRELLDLPDAMTKVLAHRERIAGIARAFAPQKRYWALVGNGKNRIAAAEIRIKLSELCYKSIGCDTTEDKKHIDLSSEPLLLVCAAGAGGSLADDTAKEVAIYKAHKATPIVIATVGEARFAAAAAVIEVPRVAPQLAYVLSTMAGHLFGYGAALAIDATSLPLKRMRSAIEAAFGNDGAAGATNALERLRPLLTPAWHSFRSELAAGICDGSLEPRTAARLTSLCNYALGIAPLDGFAVEFGTQGAPGAVVDALTQELTTAIDQLTRPIDAIKHQAKTVTVGISRADEALTTVPLVRALLDAGAVRDQIGYRDLRAMAGLDPAVAEVTGSTRYRIDGEDSGRPMSIHVLDQRGIAVGMASRTATNPLLKGAKHLVATERQCLVTKGRSDGRTVVLIPEVLDGKCVALTLLHVRFHERLPAAALRGVLASYRQRLSALTDQVMETEASFDDSLLGKLSVVELLTAPIDELAESWRSTSH